MTSASLGLVLAAGIAGSVPSADGVRIAYEVHGQGDTALVFVHGWSCDRSYWKAQLEPLSRDFKVVAVDLAGHGESGRGRQAWTIEAFGGDVAAVVDALGLQRVVLVGHSMGGDVIVAAARRLAGRVAGLVWVDTYKKLGTPRTPEQVEAFMAPFRANFAEATRTFVRGLFHANADQVLVERVAADMSSAPRDVALGALHSAITYDRVIPSALEELKLPVVAINPESPPTDVASLDRFGVKAVFLPGVGHFAQREDPERFNALLKAEVQKLLPPAAGPQARFAALKDMKEDVEAVFGDPEVAGQPFVLRIRELPGTIIPPHTHPVDENITVLEGTFFFAVADRFDLGLMKELKAGGYAFAPRGSMMFGASPDGAVVQVHGIGPFHIHWRDGYKDLDDPRAADVFLLRKGDAVTTPRGAGIIRQGYSSGTHIQYEIEKSDGTRFLALQSDTHKVAAPH